MNYLLWRNGDATITSGRKGGEKVIIVFILSSTKTSTLLQLTRTPTNDYYGTDALPPAESSTNGRGAGLSLTLPSLHGTCSRRMPNKKIYSFTLHSLHSALKDHRQQGKIKAQNSFLIQLCNRMSS
ncbi:hypothetical protein C0J52_26269 [Blattella germanica]|nr:hypothetical protein C0J52_26269 [Blattella germanica]